MKSIIKSIITKTAFLSLAILGSSYASDESSNPSVTLEPVTVYSERMELPIDQIGSTVTLISAEDIKNSRSQFVTDALRQVPGVFVRRNGGAGTATTVSLRGFQNEQTLIMIDGHEVMDSSQTSGPFNFSTMPTANIERIEIVRGPQSTLHGSEAMGGVINIITKKGDGKPTYNAQAELGSNKTLSGNFSTRGAMDGWNYSVFATQFETDGFSNQSPDGAEADDFENTTVQSNLGYSLNENASIHGFLHYQKSALDFDSFNNPNDPDVYSSTNQFVGGINADLSFMEGQWISSPGFSFSDTVSRTFSSSPSRLEGNSYTLEWQNEYKASDEISFVGGVDYQTDEASDPFSPFDKKRDSLATYIQGRYSWNDRLFINLGGRIDDNSDFGSESTWRSTASYKITETGTRLHGSYGTAFRAPTLGEQYGTFGGFATPNPNLEAEKSTGFDIGFDQELFQGSVLLGLTYFYNDIDNQIAFAFPGGFSAPGQFLNTESVRTQGYEFTLSWEPINNLTFDLNYTWTDTLDRGTGKQLARQPREMLSGIVNWRTMEDKLNLNLAARHVGDRYDFGGESSPMPSFTVLDTAFNYSINDSWESFVRIENLLDKDYENIGGFSTSDRGFYIGLSYSFQ